MKKTRNFQIDQKVVYPSQGVGVIRSVIEKTFKNATMLYYVIYLEVTDMTIMVPVDKAADLGIRPTVSRDEALKAMELIGQNYEPIPSDWKMRYQMNLDLLKKGSIKDIASIVRSLYHRSKVKELPILERKLYDSALKLLEDEMAISLRKTREEVENMIFARLEAEREAKGKGEGEGEDEVAVEVEAAVLAEGEGEAPAEAEAADEAEAEGE
jgi:CarD family transcriptional regulator